MIVKHIINDIREKQNEAKSEVRCEFCLSSRKEPGTENEFYCDNTYAEDFLECVSPYYSCANFRKRGDAR